MAEKNSNKELLEKEQIPVIEEEAAVKGLSKKRLALIAQVRTLYFVNKWTVKEICAGLNLKQNYIFKALQTIRGLAKRTVKDNIAAAADVNVFLWEVNEAYKERIKKLWQHHKDADKPMQKSMILKEIREQEAQHIELLQSLGFVPQHATAANQNIVYISHLQDKTEKVEVPLPDKPAEIKEAANEIKSDAVN